MWDVKGTNVSTWTDLSVLCNMNFFLLIFSCCSWAATLTAPAGFSASPGRSHNPFAQANTLWPYNLRQLTIKLHPVISEMWLNSYFGVTKTSAVAFKPIGIWWVCRKLSGLCNYILNARTCLPGALEKKRSVFLTTSYETHLTDLMPIAHTRCAAHIVSTRRKEAGVCRATHMIKNCTLEIEQRPKSPISFIGASFDAPDVWACIGNNRCRCLA